MVILALLLIIGWFGRRDGGAAARVWRGIVKQRVAVGFFCAVLLFIVAFVTFLVRQSGESNLRAREKQSFNSAANLITADSMPVVALDDNHVPIQPVISSTTQANTRSNLVLKPRDKAASNVIIVRPGETYRISLFANTLVIDAPVRDAMGQVRLIWLDEAMQVLSWDDNHIFAAAGRGDLDAAGFYSSAFTVPSNAARMQLEFRNIDTGGIWLRLQDLTLTSQGVYVEPHPNGTQGALAFSFDWESAMGGAIHSQGAEVHDAAAAAVHGLLMRQGADWLNRLFVDNKIEATFYGTGYNLLDGNTERRTFSGDPTYTWAKPKNNWASDYWLRHGWFSDDPFGTYKANPAWYFGDQTRALLVAGHEIAPHTFGHLYVRGSNPQELATDMDEWLKAAKAQGVPPPTTFAFPWRSSNSLTADFFDVLHSRGIRAVTRIYPLDMKDQFTLGNAVVYTDVKQAKVYPEMAVMPDFLLGAPSSDAGEESGGAVIGLDSGLHVITETLARRGTTSFWTHPEQLGDESHLQPERDSWQGVVQAAARQRDAGRLWIATVANITAYQRDVMSITVTLEKGSPAWKMVVTNNGGHPIEGVTLTLPGDAAHISSPDVQIRTVNRSDPSKTVLSPPDQPYNPARQIVISNLDTGVTIIEVEWAPGQEPLP